MFPIPGWVEYCCLWFSQYLIFSYPRSKQYIVVCGSHNILMFPIPGWAVYCCLWFSQYLHVQVEQCIVVLVLTISSCFLSQVEQFIAVCGSHNIFMFPIPGWAVYCSLCSHIISCFLSQVEQCIAVCGSCNIFMFPIPGWAVFCLLWFSQYLHVSYPRLSSVLLFVVLTIFHVSYPKLSSVLWFPIPGWAVYCCL